MNCLLPVCYEINIEIESKNLETFVVISKSNFITAKSNNEKKFELLYVNLWFSCNFLSNSF